MGLTTPPSYTVYNHNLYTVVQGVEVTIVVNVLVANISFLVSVYILLERIPKRIGCRFAYILSCSL